MGSDTQENPGREPDTIMERLEKTFSTSNPANVISKIVSQKADYLDIICLLPTIHKKVLNSVPEGSVIGADDYLPATIKYLESFLKKGDKLDRKYIDSLCDKSDQFKQGWTEWTKLNSGVATYLESLKKRDPLKEKKIIQELESQEEKSILALIIKGLGVLAFGIAVLALSGSNPIGWSVFSVGVATLFWGFCLYVIRTPLLSLLPFEQVGALVSRNDKLKSLTKELELLNEGEVAYYFANFVSAMTYIATKIELKISVNGKPMVLIMNVESPMTSSELSDLQTNLQKLVDDLGVEGQLNENGNLTFLKIGSESVDLADCPPEDLLDVLRGKEQNHQQANTLR